MVQLFARFLEFRIHSHGLPNARDCSVVNLSAQERKSKSVLVMQISKTVVLLDYRFELPDVMVDLFNCYLAIAQEIADVEIQDKMQLIGTVMRLGYLLQNLPGLLHVVFTQ